MGVYGKYADEGTLPARYDNTFKAIVSAGWANDSDGDVESPTGYFALITIAPNELDELVAAVFDDTSDYLNGYMDVPTGNFVTREDSNGIIYVERYATEWAARHEFNATARAYSEWLDADEDDAL